MLLAQNARKGIKKPPEGGIFLLGGRGEKIRTSDLFVPNEARYRSALHPGFLFCDANIKLIPRICKINPVHIQQLRLNQ